jgi:hypothetical protein
MVTFPELVDKMGSLYLDEGHPNEQGYELITANIVSAVEHRIAEHDPQN